MSLVTWQDLCIDALAVDAQARFWAAASGLEVADLESPARLTGPTTKHTVWVNPVDRPHRTKNRTHLDIDCASVDELVGLGARVLAPSKETGFGWTVMADPEDNEFCAFVRPADRLPDYRLHGTASTAATPGLSRAGGEMLQAPSRSTTRRTTSGR